MKSPDQLERENAALRDRAARLSAAILRISASLDVDTVLHEIVESARVLTGARYGAITTFDDAGQLQDFFTSGLTPHEHNQLAAWPEGARLFEHLRNLPAPLRLPDLRAYVGSLGYSAHLVPPRSFQGTPMRHRGVLVGAFFLAAKKDEEPFTDEDEEVLVLFAAQAATATANARAHREEQRARSDLAALVDTSPVGIVILDAGTGAPVLLNREAKRVVGGLGTPGRPLEELIEVLTCRFADGREIALDEVPLARVLSEAATVRADEIELSVPDGRRVRTLVNATPIRSAGGAVASVVVTLQDLAPLEELERSRAEFVGMVSHELRAPLTSIKGSTATVLGASRVLDRAEIRQFFQIIDEQAGRMDRLISDLLDAGRIDAGTLSVDAAPMDVAALVDQARNTFLSGGGRQRIRIDLPPDLPPVTADERRIVQVLNNLLSNAARHAPASSSIGVTAERDGVHVAISVSDEGEGVPPERLPHLFRRPAGGGKGGLGGSGLGLVICKGLVEAHGGRIWATAGGEGRGTRFTFTVPAAPEPADGPGGSPSPPSRATRPPSRILVLDDDPQALRYVREALTEAGHVPLVTADPGELSRLIRTEKPQLVLLDLMLPGADGIELMETVPDLADLPVIFISGYDRDETIARALEAGAADYIVKPFSPTELTARVRAALRRRAGPDPFVLGDLTIDYDQRSVTVAGRPVELTATEYELLRVLSVNAGRVSTYKALLRQVWGLGGGDAQRVRAIMKKLRRKLGDSPARPAYVFNERGVGYRMQKPGET